jgi:hypothetical protein
VRPVPVWGGQIDKFPLKLTSVSDGLAHFIPDEIFSQTARIVHFTQEVKFGR